MSDRTDNGRKSPHDSERARSTAHTTTSLGLLNPLANHESRAQRAHLKRAEGDRPPRIMSTGRQILDIPEWMKPDGVYVRWVNSSQIGRMEIAKGAYYDHIVDENGVNITREYKGQTLYLMGLEQKYRDEDQKLKERKYNAMLGSAHTIGENEYSPVNKSQAVSSSISDRIDY